MERSEQKVGSLTKFINELKVFGKESGRLLYFRGHSKKSFDLKPYIYRNDGWVANEAQMFNELVLRCPNDFSDGVSTFQSLVKMQHYGLPTRLLDITSNPLVALYFACTTHEIDDEDGEVIVFSFDIEDQPVADGKKGIKYFDSDTVSVISNLSRRPATFTPPKVSDIDAFNKADEIKLLLHDVRRDKPHFEPKIVPVDLGRVLCVKPMLDNPRIIRQEGSFLLFGIDETKRQPAKLDPANVVGRLTINMDKKKELADHLQTLGISNATLFPEVEQVSKHIKNAYFVPSVNLAKLNDATRKVFHLLSSGPAKNVRQIANEAGMAPSAVGHQIAKLNEKGLIVSRWQDSLNHWRVKDEVKVTDSVDDTGMAI